MRCSVAFGVTLRLLVINNSSSSPTINTAAYYQQCIITCETVAVIHRRPRLQCLPVAALTQAVKPDIGSESRFLRTPPAFENCCKIPEKGLETLPVKAICKRVDERGSAMERTLRKPGSGRPKTPRTEENVRYVKLLMPRLFIKY